MTTQWPTVSISMLALAVSAATYWRNSVVRREAQARLVYSKLTELNFYGVGQTFPIKTPGINIDAAVIVPAGSMSDEACMFTTRPAVEMTITVYNTSDEPIGPVKLSLTRWIGREHKAVEDVGYLCDSVEPKSEEPINLVFPWPNPPGQPSYSGVIVFRDSNGRWWRRLNREPIERIHNDPENRSWPKNIRESWDRNVRAMGREPEQPPKASLVVKFARFLRRLRRKSPLH